MEQIADASAPPSGAGGAVPRPTRSRWAVVIPAAVCAAMLLLLGVSARDALRPVREVQVVQAVHDPQQGGRHASDAPPTHAADRPVVRGAAAQAAGWIEADPFVVAAAGLAEGVVREVLVLEGDRVEAGQAIARLVSEDAQLALRAAEADAAMTEAALVIAQADVAAAETEWAEPVDRDLAVALAAAAVARAKAELAQWPATVRAERARLGEVQQRLERSRLALSAGGANEIEVLTLEREAEAQAATLEAMEAREATLLADLARAEGESRAAERGAALRVRERRELDSRRGALAAAEAAVRLAQVRRDEAALRLLRMDVAAPIAGVVQRLHATPGKRIMFNSDDPSAAIVATLYDPARLQVRVDVPLADAGGIVVGQACEVSVEVLPGATLRGVVTRIGHEADIQKNTLEVRVRLIDPPAALRPEMLSRVKFLGGEIASGETPGVETAGDSAAGREGSVLPTAHGDGSSSDATVLVPPEAVERAGGGSRVWPVRDRRGVRGVVSVEPVEVVGERDGLVMVRGGVRAGDVLVAAPHELREGMLVRMRMAGAESAKAREGGAGVRP